MNDARSTPVVDEGGMTEPTRTDLSCWALSGQPPAAQGLSEQLTVHMMDEPR